MKYKNQTFYSSFLMTCRVILAVTILSAPLFSYAKVYRDTSTPAELRKQYKSSKEEKIKILIVPGHDNETWGTQFRGTKEADMTVILAEELQRLLKKDKRLDVSITRTEEGYVQEFERYFKDEVKNIANFIAAHRHKNGVLKESGKLEVVEGVSHNVAKPDVQTKLFGINKWANENDVDLTLHVHFNDYGGRPWNTPGIHSGFTIYIPDEQYGNARSSLSIAQSIFKELKKKYSVSTLAGESKGITPDQDLIAIGSNNTLDAASVLIEYGYIYEPQFLATTTRNKRIRDMAQLTHAGLQKFLQGK